MAKPFLVLTGLFFFIVIAYAVMPAHGNMPKPTLKCLSKYNRIGCGQSTMNCYSTTITYSRRKTSTGLAEYEIADDKLRAAIDLEALELGLSKRENSDGSIEYSREWRTLLTRKGARLRISKEGRVSSGASNRKWPYL